MIVTARECHACQMLTRGLRAADIAEIAASSGESPEVALRRSMASSERVWVKEKDGLAIMMWGVAPWPGHPDYGCPWMMACEDLWSHRRDLARHTKRCIAEAGRGYVALTNFVMADHIDSIRWLTYAGFSFIDFLPEHGAGKQPFLQFFKATQHV